MFFNEKTRALTRHVAVVTVRSRVISPGGERLLPTQERWRASSSLGRGVQLDPRLSPSFLQTIMGCFWSRVSVSFHYTTAAPQFTGPAFRVQINSLFADFSLHTCVFAESAQSSLLLHPLPSLIFSLRRAFPLHWSSEWPVELMCLALGQWRTRTVRE